MAEEKHITQISGAVLASKIEAVADKETEEKAQEDLGKPDPDEATAQRIVYGEAKLVYKG